MNHAPLIFLGVFLSLASSWYGLILLPKLHLGGLQPDQVDNLARLESRANWKQAERGLPTVKGGSLSPVYPSRRPGEAQQGLEVYRANGCVYCHSQQVRQTKVDIDVYLEEAGTNMAEVISALQRVNRDLSEAGAQALVKGAPKSVLAKVNRETADAAAKKLVAAGAKAGLTMKLRGPDIERGWGLRRTVAQDYLFDYPVMLGSQRIGPDLANIGLRQPAADWHLRHLYDPQSTVEKRRKSIMPPYRYLFEKRKIRSGPSPDALKLTGESAPEKGIEIVPTPEAKALVSYLLSLRADTLLFETPMPSRPATNAVGNASANAPTNATTNVAAGPPANIPAK